MEAVVPEGKAETMVRLRTKTSVGEFEPDETPARKSALRSPTVPNSGDTEYYHTHVAVS